MAQYKIGIDSEKVKGLLVHDEGLKELICDTSYLTGHFRD